MNDILFQPATEAARMLRRREVSSRELTEALLARIEAANPRLNAVVELRGDQAFWVAHAALPGLPAVAAPVGRTAGGLPVGAQVVGPLFEDGTAVTFAGLLSEVAGGYLPPPL
jgi:Asp-tRNA(Asn)/Glu-tRNA(Gln) amidotransferase A subunit family amidase